MRIYYTVRIIMKEEFGGETIILDDVERYQAGVAGTFLWIVSPETKGLIDDKNVIEQKVKVLNQDEISSFDATEHRVFETKKEYIEYIKAQKKQNS